MKLPEQPVSWSKNSTAEHHGFEGEPTSHVKGALCIFGDQECTLRYEPYEPSHFTRPTVPGCYRWLTGGWTQTSWKAQAPRIPQTPGVSSSASPYAPAMTLELLAEDLQSIIYIWTYTYIYIYMYTINSWNWLGLGSVNIFDHWRGKLLRSPGTPGINKQQL